MPPDRSGPRWRVESNAPRTLLKSWLSQGWKVARVSSRGRLATAVLNVSLPLPPQRPQRPSLRRLRPALPEPWSRLLPADSPSSEDEEQEEDGGGNEEEGDSKTALLRCPLSTRSSCAVASPLLSPASPASSCSVFEELSLCGTVGGLYSCYIVPPPPQSSRPGPGPLLPLPQTATASSTDIRLDEAMDVRLDEAMDKRLDDETSERDSGIGI